VKETGHLCLLCRNGGEENLAVFITVESW